MAVQLFKLRNVPEDEAQEIRDLLAKNNIDYYETPAGNWGISMPAIWLHDEDEIEDAKRLIDAYQLQRAADHRNNAAPRKSFIGSLLENPMQLIMYTAFACAILYFSIKPFLNFGQ